VPAGHLAQHGVSDRGLVQRPHCGAHQEEESREAATVFRLDELVVTAVAPEQARQILLQEIGEPGAQVGEALGGEFLEDQKEF
jgi:hypothetical protein